MLNSLVNIVVVFNHKTSTDYRVWQVVSKIWTEISYCMIESESDGRGR